MKKKILIVIGVVAALDIADIIAKGQFLSVLNTFDEDTSEEMTEIVKNVGLRGKMIIGFSDIFEKIREVK